MKRYFPINHISKKQELPLFSLQLNEVSPSIKGNRVVIAYFVTFVPEIP